MFYEIVKLPCYPGERIYTAGRIKEVFDREVALVKGDPDVLTVLVEYDS